MLQAATNTILVMFEYRRLSLKGQLSGLNIKLKLNIVDEAGWSAGRLVLDSDAQMGGVSQTIPEAAEVQMTSFSRSKFAPT